MSLRRSDVGSMPMSVAFSPANWTWLRSRKRGDMPFNISAFVDRAVGREIRHMDAMHSSEKSMLDALDQDQLFTYAVRCLNKIQAQLEGDEFDQSGDVIASVVDLKKSLKAIDIEEGV